MKILHILLGTLYQRAVGNLPEDILNLAVLLFY